MNRASTFQNAGALSRTWRDSDDKIPVFIVRHIDRGSPGNPAHDRRGDRHRHGAVYLSVIQNRDIKKGGGFAGGNQHVGRHAYLCFAIRAEKHDDILIRRRADRDRALGREDAVALTGGGRDVQRQGGRIIVVDVHGRPGGSITGRGGYDGHSLRPVQERVILHRQVKESGYLAGGYRDRGRHGDFRGIL